MAELQFWFDYNSHNAYLAWCGVQNLVAKYELDLIPQPVVFAGLLSHYGSQGPAELPPKNQWMLKNVLRKAILEGIPIQVPASHPFNPLNSLRATLCVDEPAQRRALTQALFEAIWSEQQDPSAESTIAEAAAKAGLDGALITKQMHDPDIKDALHVQTRKAIRQGIFGVPSMIVNEELFWGYDDLEFLDLFLAGQDPVDEACLRPWLRLRPSAIRRP